MRILIVEDTANHMANAVQAVRKAAREKGISIEILLATTALDAENEMGYEEALVDGVISDVYMPLNGTDDRWSHSDCPCGLNVVARARKLHIPVAFCTDGSHHGKKIQWLFSLCQEGALELPKLVGGKDWTRALEIILEEIAKK